MDQNGLEIVFLDHLFFVKEVREVGDPRHLFKEIFFAKKTSYSIGGYPPPLYGKLP